MICLKAFKFILSFLCLIVALLLFFSFPKKESSPVSRDILTDQSSFPTIIIDAGHGGEDGGAQSDSGLLEKDINLSISRFLKCYLDISGFDTYMIREDDRQIYDSDCKTLREKKVSDIHNRTEICNSNENSIYVSIHQNKFSDKKYSGAQVFYSSNTAKSEELAGCIRESLISLLQPQNTRQIKESGEDIYILHNATNPCVLIECGFLSNDAESKLLADEQYRKKMAFSVYLGIVEYLYSNYQM